MDSFIDTLHSWQNFYFMSGGAAAALLGLMFVALSLGTHLINAETRQNMQAFVTPSLVYFVSALLLACAMLVPMYDPRLLGLILILGGAAGLARITPSIRMLIQAARKHQDFTREDWLASVMMPVTSYGLLVAAGVGMAAEQWALGFAGACLANVLLVVAGIANTWSLVLWIVDHRVE